MRIRPSRFLFWSVALGLLGVSAVAYAILPAIGMWMLSVSGGSLMVWDIGIGLSGVLAGMLWADCTYQITSCQSTTEAQKLVSANDNGAKKPLTVDLRPTVPRPNPKPTTYDNAVAPARDPTPKATFNMNQQDTLYTNFSNFQALANDIGGYGSKKYSYNNGNWAEFTASATAIPGNTSQWQGTASFGYTLLYITGTGSYTCPSGYSCSGGTATLTNVAETKKPSTTPCQVLYDSTSKSFQFDSANTRCDGLASTLVGSDGKMKVTDNAGATTTIAPQSGGGFKITKTNLDGSWKSVDTAPYDPAQSGYPIVGSSSGSTPSSNPDPGTSGGGTSGGGTTGGTGTGTGTSGTGTGDCAGYGCAKETTQQDVLTSVRDITKAADQAAVTSAYDSDAKAAQLVTDLQGKFKQASDYNGITSQIAANLGLPPGGQCSNAVFNWTLIGRPMTVDFVWLCGPIAPIVNWFFWMLVTIAAISEVIYILTGRGLPGDNIDATVTDDQANNWVT